jgi:hypothetical protein
VKRLFRTNMERFELERERDFASRPLKMRFGSTPATGAFPIKKLACEEIITSYIRRKRECPTYHSELTVSSTCYSLDIIQSWPVIFSHLFIVNYVLSLACRP